MNFALTDDQVMIRDAAASFLADASGSVAVRVAMESVAGFDAGAWQRIGEELGWCGVAIGEAHGGMGLGPVELVLIQEQAGRHLLCAPFFSTVCVAADLLQQVGNGEAMRRSLPAIAEGRLRASTALPSVVDWISSATGLRARRAGEGWALDGRCPRVPDASGADVFFLLAQTELGEPGLFAVERQSPGVEVRTHEGWDATRRFSDLELTSVPAVMRCDDPQRFADGLARAAALVRLYVAAEQLGGAQRCLDMTVEYTAGRKQFGRPVAGFQAVKHRCAEMMVRVEALRSAVYGAAAVAAGSAGTEALALECAMAKALASETYFFCAQEAIQLHGGVGFTWEFDVHLYFKRAQASQHWLGTPEQLREQMAQVLLDKSVA